MQKVTEWSRIMVSKNHLDYGRSTLIALGVTCGKDAVRAFHCDIDVPHEVTDVQLDSWCHRLPNRGRMKRGSRGGTRKHRQIVTTCQLVRFRRRMRSRWQPGRSNLIVIPLDGSSASTAVCP